MKDAIFSVIIGLCLFVPILAFMKSIPHIGGEYSPLVVACVAFLYLCYLTGQSLLDVSEDKRKRLEQQKKWADKDWDNNGF